MRFFIVMLKKICSKSVVRVRILKKICLQKVVRFFYEPLRCFFAAV